MEKMMSFEEWDLAFNGDREETETTRRGWFNAARIGTIPAENAVVIPPVSEWPEDAEGVAICYRFEHEWENQADWSRIKWIPRPKPVWVPRVGEAVFANGSNGNVFVGRLAEEVDKGEFPYLVKIGEKNSLFSEVKPFHESHIGKKWSEIPS